MKKKMRMLGLMLVVSSLTLVSCEKDYMEDDDSEQVLLGYSNGAYDQVIDLEETTPSKEVR